MDGIVMNQFQRFVIGSFGREAWPALIQASGVMLGDELLPVDATYPDSDLFALVLAASAIFERPVPELLEQFGRYLAPSLLRIYAPLIEPRWRTLDVIENTEGAIHRVVRQRNPKAAPPELRVERRSADRVMIDYRSQRKLCTVAVGLSYGIAAHFGETIRVEQSECMHRGDSRCLIVVTREDA